VKRIVALIIATIAAIVPVVILTNSSSSAQAGSKIVYLTFDDGPTAGYTDEVLTHLNQARAHATFFQVGEHMAGNEALMRKILADGNQIGTHSWDHPAFGNITNGAATWEEIQRPRASQITITGHDSRLFRYPHFQRTNYGDLVLTYLGMHRVDADLQPQDYDQEISDAAVISQVMSSIHNGSIVCLHDGYSGATRDGGHPNYLPALLKQLKTAGYTFGTLEDVSG
jgi:peptidoglycan-N-acetylglucosamine deacetylase